MELKLHYDPVCLSVGCSVGRAGRIVCLSEFPKRARSFTSKLLSEPLLLQRLQRLGVVDLAYFMRPRTRSKIQCLRQMEERWEAAALAVVVGFA